MQENVIIFTSPILPMMFTNHDRRFQSQAHTTKIMAMIPSLLFDVLPSDISRKKKPDVPKNVWNKYIFVQPRFSVVESISLRLVHTGGCAKSHTRTSWIRNPLEQNLQHTLPYHSSCDHFARSVLYVKMVVWMMHHLGKKYRHTASPRKTPGPQHDAWQHCRHTSTPL